MMYRTAWRYIPKNNVAIDTRGCGRVVKQVREGGLSISSFLKICEVLSVLRYVSYSKTSHPCKSM